MSAPHANEKDTPAAKGTDAMQVLRWVIGTLLIAALLVGMFLYEKNIKMLFNEEGWVEAMIPVFKHGFLILLLCSLFCLFRIMMGPTAPDRAVSLDILGTLIVGFCAILSIASGRSWYIDIGIAWALQSFIGSLALAKYLEGKHLDE